MLQSLRAHVCLLFNLATSDHDLHPCAEGYHRYGASLQVGSGTSARLVGCQPRVEPPLSDLALSALRL